MTDTSQPRCGACSLHLGGVLVSGRSARSVTPGTSMASPREITCSMTSGSSLSSPITWTTWVELTSKCLANCFVVPPVSSWESPGWDKITVQGGLAEGQGGLESPP